MSRRAAARPAAVRARGVAVLAPLLLALAACSPSSPPGRQAAPSPASAVPAPTVDALQQAQQAAAAVAASAQAAAAQTASSAAAAAQTAASAAAAQASAAAKTAASKAAAATAAKAKTAATCAAAALKAGKYDPTCKAYQGYLDPGGAGRAPTSGELQMAYGCHAGYIPASQCTAKQLAGIP